MYAYMELYAPTDIYMIPIVIKSMALIVLGRGRCHGNADEHAGRQIGGREGL